MILARITQALKTQNWLAVALEFVIVVAGVLLAFQVSAWNEYRQDQGRVALALERLQLETEQNIAALRQRNTYNEARVAERTIMVEIAMRGSLAEGEAETFERAVAQLMYFSRPPVQQSTYDALEQSGDLALITDRDLVIELNRYQSQLNWIETQHSSFRGGLSTFTDTLEDFIFHEPTDDPTVTRARVDLDRLNADPRHASALTQMARMHAIFARYLIALEADTVTLCERLSEDTGRPCGTEDAP